MAEKKAQGPTPEERAKAKADYLAKRAELAKKRAKRIVGNLLITTLIVSTIVVGLSAIGLVYVSMLVIIGLLPGFVAISTDGRSGRFASKTVMSFNISGICPHLAAIFGSGSPNQTALYILQDPKAWLLVYGFAAFGWGVVFLIPHIAFLYYELKASFMVKKFLGFQNKLLDEWGDDIRK